MKTTFDLVNELNTIGAFRRARADRAIEHAPTDDRAERQSRQIQRDLDNLDFLTQACDEAQQIFRDALLRLKEFTRSPRVGAAV